MWNGIFDESNPITYDGDIRNNSFGSVQSEALEDKKRDGKGLIELLKGFIKHQKQQNELKKAAEAEAALKAEQHHKEELARQQRQAQDHNIHATLNSHKDLSHRGILGSIAEREDEHNPSPNKPDSDKPPLPKSKPKPLVEDKKDNLKRQPSSQVLTSRTVKVDKPEVNEFVVDDDDEGGDSEDFGALPMANAKPSGPSLRPTSAVNTSLGALQRRAASNGVLRTVNINQPNNVYSKAAKEHLELASKPAQAYPTTTMSANESPNILSQPINLRSKNQPQKLNKSQSNQNSSSNLSKGSRSRRDSFQVTTTAGDKTPKLADHSLKNLYQPEYKTVDRLSTRNEANLGLHTTSADHRFGSNTTSNWNTREDEYLNFAADPEGEESQQPKRNNFKISTKPGENYIRPTKSPLEINTKAPDNFLKKNNVNIVGVVPSPQTFARSTKRNNTLQPQSPKESTTPSMALKRYEKQIEKDLSRALTHPYPMANIVELTLGPESTALGVPKAQEKRSQRETSMNKPARRERSTSKHSTHNTHSLERNKLNNFLQTKTINLALNIDQGYSEPVNGGGQNSHSRGGYLPNFQDPSTRPPTLQQPPFTSGSMPKPPKGPASKQPLKGLPSRRRRESQPLSGRRDQQPPSLPLNTLQITADGLQGNDIDNTVLARHTLGLINQAKQRMEALQKMFE